MVSLFSFLFPKLLNPATWDHFPNKIPACQPLPPSVLFGGWGGGRALTNTKLYSLLLGASSPKRCGLSIGDLLLPDEREGNEM